MRHLLLASTALVALAWAPASFAFEIQTVKTNPDGSIDLTVPKNLTDNTAPGLTGGASDGALHFGNATVTLRGGNDANGFGARVSGMSPALQERLMIGPYAAGGTARLR